MYTPRGFSYSELGDVEVVSARGRLHLFHLTLPNHDVVQHAVSDDGLAWHPLPDAIRTGDPGECDDDAIWTMSVTERDGRFFMLYTALSRAEDGQIQRTGLATSDDLIHWVKHPGNPVASPDPRWYEADLAASGRVSWRDPKPVLVGDTYFATLNAREASGPLLRRGCVGLLASRDLESWEVRPPLFAPRAYWDIECPQVFRAGDHWYLAAATIEDRVQHYWLADEFEGRYDVPSDGGALAPFGHYAGRVCEWQGRHLFFGWHKLWHIGDYDWPGFRNPAGKFLVAPLVLDPRPDGSLARRSYPGWTDYYLGQSEPAKPDSRTLFHGMPVGDAEWVVQADGRLDVLATTEGHGDFCLEGQLTLAGRRGGLAFRLDADGGGYFLEMEPGRDTIVLRKWLPAPATDGRPWFTQVELQRGRLSHPLADGEPADVRLISNGQYIELSVDGEVAIATLSGERLEGAVGIWAESGRAEAHLSLVPMRQPNAR